MEKHLLKKRNLKGFYFIGIHLQESNLKYKIYATDAASKLINNASNNPRQIKAKEIMKDLKKEIKHNIPTVKQNFQKTYHELLHAAGIYYK